MPRPKKKAKIKLNISIEDSSNTHKNEDTKTKTKENKLLAKRQAEKLRYDKIKNDPQRYEALLAKRKARYQKDKAEGKILPICKMKPIDRKRKKERNRINALNHYHRSKNRKLKSSLGNNYAVEHDPPQPGPSSIPPNSKKNIPKSTFHAKRAFDVAELNTSSESSECCKVPPIDQAQSPQSPRSPASTVSVSSCYKTFQSSLNKYVLRKEHNMEHVASPLPGSPDSSMTSASTLVHKASLKRLKYQHERQIKELQQKITTLKQVKERYRQKMLRYKTKLQKSNKGKIPCPTQKNVIKLSSYRTDKMIRIKKEIVRFYEEDDISRICPGKKEYITRKQVKKQKRYLNDTMKNSYEVFKKRVSQKVSYSTFCRLRPFWVCVANTQQRETCACTQHLNMQLLISGLKRRNIISENSCSEVCRSLCCDLEKVDCLRRKCTECKTKVVAIKEFDDLIPITYWQWVKKKNTYTKDSKDKHNIITEKIKIVTNPRTAIAELEKMLVPFLYHCAVITNQTKSVKKIKENLTAEECFIHIDFSENYATKFAVEVQALHFGGSRTQITLHTSVLYYFHQSRQDDDGYKTQSYCTLSACLKHDACAVWAHIDPLLEFIEKNAPQVKVVHLLSDSTAAQYRNKTMFYIMSQLHTNHPQIERLTWSYSESGHGKGAPDGVGGVLKRTADQAVSHGKDIASMTDLMNHLQANVKGVVLEEVAEHKIYEKELLLPPTKKLKPFSGTMQVHQVVWNKDDKNVLAMRSMTCMAPECFLNTVMCTHERHVGFYKVGDVSTVSTPNASFLIKGSSSTRRSLTTTFKNAPEKKIRILSIKVIKPKKVNKPKNVSKITASAMEFQQKDSVSAYEVDETDPLMSIEPETFSKYLDGDQSLPSFNEMPSLNETMTENPNEIDMPPDSVPKFNDLLEGIPKLNESIMTENLHQAVPESKISQAENPMDSEDFISTAETPLASGLLQVAQREEFIKPDSKDNKRNEDKQQQNVIDSRGTMSISGLINSDIFTESDLQIDISTQNIFGTEKSSSFERNVLDCHEENAFSNLDENQLHVSHSLIAIPRSITEYFPTSNEAAKETPNLLDLPILEAVPEPEVSPERIPSWSTSIIPGNTKDDELRHVAPESKILIETNEIDFEDFIPTDNIPNKPKSFQETQSFGTDNFSIPGLNLKDFPCESNLRTPASKKQYLTSAIDSAACSSFETKAMKPDKVENTAITIGSWLIAEYKIKKYIKHYVGQVLDITDSSDYEVKFTRRIKRSQTFTWPIEPDIDNIDISSIRKVLKNPSKNRRAQLMFEDIDFDNLNIQ